MIPREQALLADEAALLAAYRAMNHATRDILLSFVQALTAPTPARRARPALALVQSNPQQCGGA